MVFSIQTKELASALSELAPLAAKKKAMMILNNIKCVVKGNRMRLQASDIELTVRKYVNLTDSAEDGEFLVDGVKFSGYVATLLDGECKIDILDNVLTLTCGKSKAKFSVLPATEFPEPANIGDVVKMTLPASALMLAITTGKGFVDKDSNTMRPQMRPIYAQTSGHTLTYSATDTRMLVTDEIEIPGGELPEAAWFIEQCAFPSLTAMLRSAESVDVEFAPNGAVYRSGATTIFTLQTKGKYPDVKRVIPRDSPIKCKFAKSAVADPLKRVSLFTDKVRAVAMNVSPFETFFTATNVEEGCEAKENFECEADGELRLGVNADILSGCIARVESPEVEMCLKSESTPILILDAARPQKRIVLMPLHIS